MTAQTSAPASTTQPLSIRMLTNMQRSNSIPMAHAPVMYSHLFFSRCVILSSPIIAM